MGFRSGAYCTVWGVDPVSDSMTKLRVSISRKNKNTNEYETDFSGYISVIGHDVARSAANLKEKDRIKIGDADVSTVYNKEKGVTYTNFKVFGFEKLSNNGFTSDTSFIEVDDNVDADELPF